MPSMQIMQIMQNMQIMQVMHNMHIMHIMQIDLRGCIVALAKLRPTDWPTTVDSRDASASKKNNQFLPGVSNFYNVNMANSMESCWTNCYFGASAPSGLLFQKKLANKIGPRSKETTKFFPRVRISQLFRNSMFTQQVWIESGKFSTQILFRCFCTFWLFVSEKISTQCVDLDQELEKQPDFIPPLH